MRKIVFILFLMVTLLGTSCKTGTKGKPKGIIVLSPEIAEIICALGAEAEIIGVSEECNYPPSLATKARVGNFSSINREQILSLNPRIVFCSSLEQEGMANELIKLGLQVAVIYPKSLNELISETERIGKLIGREKEAAVLASKLKSEIDEIEQKAKGKSKPKVYLEIYRNPLMSVSDASFVGELIETAGGDNIFSTLERDYARVNPEAIINAAPEIMICYSQDKLPDILSRKGWQNIPAIQNKTIYFETELNPDLLQRATPRCIEGMRQLQNIFENARKGQ